MDYTAILQEIQALLEVQNGKFQSMSDNIAFLATQQAATSQSAETFYYLCVGLLGGIVMYLGISFGAKYIKALLEVITKWL